MKQTITEQQGSTENSFEPQDKHDYYKVEDIEDTIFKKATSDTRIIFTMGKNIIADAQTQKEAEQIEKQLKRIDTKLIIPIIAATLQLIKETEVQKQ